MACGSGPAAGTHQLSSLPWSSAGNSWGPVERDMSNGDNQARDGRTITIAGTTYAKGLGVNALSEVVYYLGGSCTSLTTDVGVDAEANGRGSVTFEIYKDAAKVADSGLMLAASAAKHLTADLTGADELHLVVTDGGDGTNSDHADWANPVLTC
ncbi:NPCBM/NEW2 domain-containing protein [Kitasatospora sp. NBC_00085]|uniref:NPCBM/NEW2 domain-containing protein n=1 Tax=Kitasatospora sp. NBC_00085 TaxID=2903566 RepID=UPI003253F548